MVQMSDASACVEPLSRKLAEEHVLQQKADKNHSRVTRFWTSLPCIAQYSNYTNGL